VLNRLRLDWMNCGYNSRYNVLLIAQQHTTFNTFHVSKRAVYVPVFTKSIDKCSLKRLNNNKTSRCVEPQAWWPLLTNHRHSMTLIDMGVHWALTGVTGTRKVGRVRAHWVHRSWGYLRARSVQQTRLLVYTGQDNKFFMGRIRRKLWSDGS